MNPRLKSLFVGLGFVAGAGVAGGAALGYESHQIGQAVQQAGYKDVGVSVNWLSAQFVAKNSQGKPVSGTANTFFVGTPQLKYDSVFKDRVKATP